MSNTQKRKYTRTQQAMLDVLADGKNHTREELHACCGPSSRSVVAKHLHILRTKLHPEGHDVVCTFYRRRICYKLVRLLASPYDGRK